MFVFYKSSAYFYPLNLNTEKITYLKFHKMLNKNYKPFNNLNYTHGSHSNIN